MFKNTYYCMCIYIIIYICIYIYVCVCVYIFVLTLPPISGELTPTGSKLHFWWAVILFHRMKSSQPHKSSDPPF